MVSERHDDPDGARAALERARSSGLAGDRDRRVHGLATAGFGLLIGAYAAATRADALEDNSAVLAAGYVVIALLIAAWQRRSARAVPLGARRVGWIGIATTVAALIVALGVVNTIYRSTGETPIALALMGIAVALPMVVAGLIIARPEPHPDPRPDRQ